MEGSCSLAAQTRHSRCHLPTLHSTPAQAAGWPGVLVLGPGLAVPLLPSTLEAFAEAADSKGLGAWAGWPGSKSELWMSPSGCERTKGPCSGCPGGAWGQSRQAPGPGLGQDRLSCHRLGSRPQGTQHRQTPDPSCPHGQSWGCWPRSWLAPSAMGSSQPFDTQENGPWGFLLLLLPQASCLRRLWVVAGPCVATASQPQLLALLLTISRSDPA